MVPVLGAGVSKFTADLPGWTELIKRGLEYVTALGTHSTDDISRVGQLLADKQTIAAAEQLKILLEAGGEYPRWLKSEFEIDTSQVTDPALIHAINDLLCPITATTNYDKLVSTLHFARPISDITWQEPDRMFDALQNGHAVFHLHGVYDEPESVIFGAADYEGIVNSAPAYRDVMRTLWLDRTLLFIGCSFDGIEDPDFITHLRWAAATFPGSVHKHYALFRAGTYSKEDVRRFLRDWRIQIVSFGPAHSDLVPFIENLNPRRDEARHQRAERLRIDAGGALASELGNVDFLRVTEQIGELSGQLASKQKTEYKERIDEYRALLNRGCTELARGALADLIKELDTAPATEVADSVRANANITAANAFIHGGDSARASQYLANARPFLNGDAETAAYKLAEARLTALTKGKEAALALLSDVTTPDTERVRFVINLDFDDLDACTEIVNRLAASGALDEDGWFRLLVIYYGRIGDVEKLNALLAGMASLADAADYASAASALHSIAYERYRQVCSTHEICPESNLAAGLGLKEFIDGDARERAIEYFVKAADAYERHGCLSEVARELANAIRMAIDVRGNESPSLLVERLRTIAPDDAFLKALDGEKVEHTDSIVADVENWVSAPPREPAAILDLVGGAHLSSDQAQRVLSVLTDHADIFREHDDTAARYLHVLFNLHMAVDSASQTEAWIEKVDPPASYPHLQTALQLLYYLSTAPEKLAGKLEAAATEFPQQPEILNLVITSYATLDNYDEALVHARKLFDILGTGGAATILLEVLFSSHHYEECIAFAEKHGDLPIEPLTLHRCVGLSSLALSKYYQAIEHLDWLRAADKARRTDLLHLAQAQILTGNTDGAITVLRETVDKFAEDPEAYLLLSGVYLELKQNTQSYEWAVAAAERFTEDPDVMFNLFTTGFATGFSNDERVGKALQAFMPGGRFADTQKLSMMPVEEGMQMMLGRQEWARSVHALYEQGRASLMLICHIQDVPLFRAHMEGVQFGQSRYAGLPLYAYDLSRFLEPSRQIALDYSALLTLWSMYGERWVGTLASNYDKIWISARLQGILTWEHDRLAQLGQPDRHAANILVRDTINRLPAKFHRLNRLDPPGAQDIAGEYTEATSAKERALPLLHEHISEDAEFPDVKIVGIRTLVQAMTAAGAITPQLRARLLAHTREPRPDESAVASQLARGSSIVVRLHTLETVALQGGEQALQALSGYFGDIFYSEPAWTMLQGDIDEFARLRSMVDAIGELRGQLGAVIGRGLVEPFTAPVGMKVINEPQPRDERDSSGENFRDTKVGDFEYINDLFAAAQTYNAPILADDRWLLRLASDPSTAVKPPDSFNSASFLVWNLLRNGNRDEYYENYGKLIQWRYLGLPLNADYLYWLIEQGYAPDTGLVADIIALSRYNIISSLQPSDAKVPISAEFKEYLFTSYSYAVIALLFKCYRADIPVERVGLLFKQLDLTTFADAWPDATWRFYTLIITEVLFGKGFTDIVNTNTGVPNGEIAQAVLSFLDWSETIMREGGVDQARITAAKAEVVLRLPSGS